MENILEIKGISKNYKGFKLDNISFNIPKGSIMGFVGENGAGKSTTIRAILDIIQTDTGEIKIFGKSNKNENLRQDIGVVLDENHYPSSFKLKHINNILKNIYTNWSEKTFFEYSKKFGLPQNKKISTFSRGMSMKLSLSIALSHNAKLLILDEPTSGLDPVVRNEILDEFLNFMQDEEKGILMSSHITSDLEKVADYITFISDGKILLIENKDTIRYDYGILKCTKEQFESIDKTLVLSKRVVSNTIQGLIKEKNNFILKYPNIIVDNANLEEVMILLNKGERV